MRPTLYPLLFRPLPKVRVWGGHELERRYGKPWSGPEPIGESWEIVDRPGDVSVIANGPLAGRDLRWLLETAGVEVLGEAPAVRGRFPLLIKLLDARETLSIQVHPPESIAASLGGEPKTEIWYVAAAAADSLLYAGLRAGQTREDFERHVRAVSVGDALHRIQVRAGDLMFIPSGRVHALGAGLVIFEIQQNSDTTYRVFDWNRVGTDGRARELHERESLASIDFADIEPALVDRPFAAAAAGLDWREVVSHSAFRVLEFRAEAAVHHLHALERRPWVVAATRGCVEIEHAAGNVALPPGHFSLLPAALDRVDIHCNGPAGWLLARP